MDDLLNEFLTETAENMDKLDMKILDLERNPNDSEVLASIFRLVHTIKGTCGFFGLSRLEAIAHAAENVFGKFRDKKLIVKPEYVSIIFESLDRIKEILNVLEMTEKEPEGCDDSLIRTLNHLSETGELLSENVNLNESIESNQDHQELDEQLGTSLDGMKMIIDEFGFKQLVPMTYKEEMEHIDAQKDSEDDSIGARHFSEKNNSPVLTTQPNNTSRTTSVTSLQTLRVQVDVLEHLMTMVSELVLTRNQLLQILRGREDTEFDAPLQRLNHITTDLQEGVLKTRMQPIGNVWSKFPRIIRDLSVELGKKIDVQMIGSDTELDRQVLEIIKDPLVHMIRNSADHGIELPDERISSGKSSTGVIILNAYHEGGYIHIEISDDGRGLDLTRIKDKILASNLASASELESMSEHQIEQFIFHPGLSTAREVTSVSGRGVGMDVVRSNIHKIGGSVDFKTSYGKGSTFLIKIPLTLAIVSALIVECDSERFAIPQISVVELVRVGGEHGIVQIEQINGAPVLRLRDQLLPLISLREVLEFSEDKTDQYDFTHKFIVIIQVNEQMIGIIVDRIYDSEEIVVKPLSSVLRSISSLFSGNTILGDGSVIMILDVNEITHRVITVSNRMIVHKPEKERNFLDSSTDKIALFIFRAANDIPKAVPLSLVARLEEIDFSTIEYVNGQHVVQYRGSIMPILAIYESVTIPKESRHIVLVFSEENKSIGLIIDEILDIVDQPLNIEFTGQKGIIGSSIVNGRVTEIVDVSYFLSRGFPEWFKSRKIMGHFKKEVLLVDDSAFFRNLIVPILVSAGFDVTVSPSAEKALEFRDSGRMFQVIMTDIEMPVINGFQFCIEAHRPDSIWKDIPVIALSSRSSKEDIAQAYKLGFTDYVAKQDHSILVNVLNKIINGEKLAA